MNTRPLLPIVGTLVAAQLLLLAAPFALAQGTVGSADIRVSDTDGAPLSNAVVRLADESIGWSRVIRTDANGKAWARLAPGEYSLAVEKAGYQSAQARSLFVEVGVEARLAIQLRSEQIQEIVVYESARSLMHIATGESGLNISLQEISQLPIARSIEDVALMAPGTVQGIASFGGDKTLVSFGGASVAENVYYIDGLNVSDFRTGLGGASVPFEFYENFQIATGGYSPEFGRSTGGVLNATTRRGSNEFEFGVVSFFEPESLRENSPDSFQDDGTIYDLNSADSGSKSTIDLYASGPIIRDKLFFFVLYEPRDIEAVYVNPLDVNRQIVEKTDGDFWGGNFSWQVSRDHRLSLTAFTDKREIVSDSYAFDADNQSRGDFVGQSTDFRGGDNYILSYQGDLSDRLTIALQYGRNEYDLTTSSTTDAECPLVLDFRASAPTRFPGCWQTGFARADSDERDAYRFDAYFTMGDHRLRAGIDWEDNTSFSASTYSGTDFVPDRVGGANYRYETFDVGEVLANGAIVPDANGDGSPVDTVRFRYQEVGGNYGTSSRAWYVEDQWQINDEFAVSLGIRNEKFENRNGADETFIEIDDQWAPRVALEWSPGGLGEQKVTANYGRFYLPIAAQANVAFGVGLFDTRRYFLTDGIMDPVTGAPVALGPDGVPTTQELGSEVITRDGSVPDTRSVLDRTIKPMFQDEWMLAYQREINDEWSGSVRYIYRDLKSTIEDITTLAGLDAIGANPSVIGFSQPCVFILANPGTPVTTYCDVDGDGDIEETSFTVEELGFPKAERTYEAVEVTVKRNFDGRWSLQGSYTWSKNLGNIEGRVKSDLGQEAAGTTEDFDHPQSSDGAYGYLPNDRRHKLKLWGTYQATDRLLLSANLLVQSGRPKNTFGEEHPDGRPPWPTWGDTFYVAQPDGSFEFAPRGSDGRTDTLLQLNLTAMYNFEWGERTNVELRVDVFNVFDSDTVTEIGEHVTRTDISSRFGIPLAYQQPRYVRFGAAIRF